MDVIILWLVGLAIGSFLNCLVYRLNNNLSFLKGRSFCPKCKHKLSWSDNIPLLSFFLLRGKCQYCKKKISWFYPLVEFATALLTVFVALKLGKLDIFFFYCLFIFWALVAVFSSDLQYQTIPDEIVLSAIGASLIFLLIFQLNLFVSHLLAGLGLGGFFLFLVLITQKKGMGLGDVKLAGLIGLFLGFPLAVFAVFSSFLTGAAWGVILILGGRKNLKSRIAFGPFLVGMAMITFFFSTKILVLISNLFGI